jgi:hypothetical protein
MKKKYKIIKPTPQLKRKLLSIAGKQISPQQFYPILIQRGLVQYGKIYNRIFGKLPKGIKRQYNQCVEISGKIAGLEGYVQSFGYALSDDSMWRPHYWSIFKEKIIEPTPVKRDIYFGISLYDPSRTR